MRLKGIRLHGHGWAFLALGALCLPGWILAVDGPARFPQPDRYTQTIEIRFKTVEAATKARLHVAPLYHDLAAAFSSRWDDNMLDDLRLQGIMAKYKQTGTFYLTDPAGWYSPSETGVTFTGNPALTFAQALLRGGNSIGGHTLTHEFLPALSKNRAFREILGVRVEREVNSQSPVVCFTYPFVSYKAEADPVRSHEDLEEMIARSGYLFLGEHHPDVAGATRFPDAIFISCDGGTWGSARLEEEARKTRDAAERPLFLSTMHAWQKQWGGPTFPKLVQQYEKWGHEKNWWYCNQNQYASYRTQFSRTDLRTERRGGTLTATLERADPLDLNDLTPISLVVEGVSRGEIASVSCPTAQVRAFPLQGRYGFDLFQDGNRGLPLTFAKVENPENLSDPAAAKAAPEIPGLRAILYRKDGELVLTLVNGGVGVLRDIHVTFRLPLRWEAGVVRQTVEDMDPGASRTARIPLEKRTEDFAFVSDDEFDVAQIDLVDSKRVRLYSTCRVKGPDADPSYPRDGFLALGPLPRDRSDFDYAKFTEAFLGGASPKGDYGLFEGVNVRWRAPGPAETSFLDPDIVWTTGKSASLTFYTWDANLHYKYGADLHFLLWGKVVSPDRRTVKAVFVPSCVERISVNGKPMEGSAIRLRKGVNDLRILYVPAPNPWSCFSERCYGAYFRLVDVNGERLKDLRFERPKAP